MEFEYLEQAMEIGVQRFLRKPLDRLKIVRILQAMRDLIQQEQELRNH